MKIDNFESKTIDIMKFIGIVFVVIGHYPGDYFNIMSPYLFHMPLFFFIAGITLKSGNPIKKSIHVFSSISKYSVITYIVTGLIAVSLSKRFDIDLGYPFADGVLNTIIYTLKQNFHNNPLFLVCWFLLAYCTSYLLSSLIVSFASYNTSSKVNPLLLTVISIAFGVIAIKILSPYYDETKLQYVNVAAQTLYASMFMIIGNVFGLNLIKRINSQISLFIFIALSFIYLAKYIQPTVMSWSIYPSGFLMTTTVSLLCIFIVTFLSKCAALSGATNLLVAIGKSSKHIMAYHLSVFILMDFIFSQLGYWDMKNTTVFKHYYTPEMIMIYPAAGLLIPTAGYYAFLKIKTHQRANALS
ncbi:acyltransferase family protein [Salmonella enterica]|nr:acyltransferase family protein [Salmonella enterica]